MHKNSRETVFRHFHLPGRKELKEKPIALNKSTLRSHILRSHVDVAFQGLHGGPLSIDPPPSAPMPSLAGRLVSRLIGVLPLV